MFNKFIKWLPILAAGVIAAIGELEDRKKDEKIEELEQRVSSLEEKENEGDSL